MSSGLRRAAFALRFGEYNLLGSGLINKDSRILYIRDVRERVQTLAPFLDFDADPYPVITNGRMVWVLDGYTTSSRYPYSENADNDELSAEQRPAPHLQLRPQLGEGHGRRLRRHRHLLRDRSHRPGHQRLGQGLPRPVHAGRRGAARAGGSLPLSRGPVPGADQHVRPVPRRRPRTSSSSGTSSGASPRSRRRRSSPGRLRSRRPARPTASRPPAPGRPASTRTTRSCTCPGEEAASSPSYGRSCPSRRTTSARTSSRSWRCPAIRRPTANSACSTSSRPSRVDGPALIDSEIKRKYAADFTLESQTGSKVRLGTLQAHPDRGLGAVGAPVVRASGADADPAAQLRGGCLRRRGRPGPDAGGRAEAGLP